MTAATPESRLSRLGRWAVRHRRIVAVSWLVVLVLAIVGGPKIAGDWTVDYATPGSDSKAAEATITKTFPNLSVDTLLLTWNAPKGATSAPVKARVQEVLGQLKSIPGIAASANVRPQISADHATGLIEVPLTKSGSNIAVDSGPALMKIANAASADGATIKFGGQVMQEAERGAISSEGVGLLVALIILLLTFGTIIAAGLPIAVALFGIGTASALVGGIAAFVNTPDWAESVAVMVGIGVGIDYALLILTRHRAALAAGQPVEDAVAGALSTAGRSVLVAGGTVVISLLGLLLMGLPYLTGVAFSAGITVLVVMIASLTLLPALLGFAGLKINSFAVRMPGKGAAARRAAKAERLEHARRGLPADASPRFASWTRAVQRRPWTAAVAGVALIAVLAAPLIGVRLGFPGMGNQPAGTQARTSYDMLTKGFGPGIAGPIRIVAPITSPAVQAKVAELGKAIAADPLVAAVRPAIYSADGTTALMTVQSKFSADQPKSEELLGNLRDDLIPASRLNAKVAGLTAQTHDQSVATEQRLPLLFIGVAGLSALLLLAAFRSVLIPLKAAALNLLSILAAYGVVALVAEGGFVGQLFGVDTNVPIPPFIPVLMFAILFGLSMDYEVFLVGRIREFWLKHGDPSRAVTEGMASTARVITAAAAIMIAVFGAFALSDQIFLKLIGIGMASAILIDATVIRLLLVPSVMQLLGKRAWWMPAWLDRLVPGVDVEGGSPSGAHAGHGAPAGRGAADATS